MRRLITYLAIAGGLIVGMALNFMGVVQTTRGNLEFANGRELVYRLTDKDDQDAIIPEGAVADIAATMEDRLETALVTKYEIETEGNNQIRVTLGENTDIAYQRIRNYLNFDGEFSICTTTDVCAIGDEMFDGSVARVDYKGQYPHVVIPLSNPTYFIDQIVAEAERLSEEFPAEEGQVDPNAYILLWANRLEGETYEETKTNQKIAEKIILQFNFKSIWWDEEDKTEITAAVDLSKYGTANEQNIYPSSAVAQANETANYFANLFNAGSLDYDVEFLFEAPISASIENILTFGRNIGLSWSNTLLASLVASIIVIGVVAYFYRLLSVAVLTASGASLFVTTTVFNLIGLQFSSATIIGMLVVALLTLLGGILFSHKFRNELYRGRTMKKAFIESSRKITWPLLDLSIVTLLFGLLTYILGGNLVRNFSVFIMLGAVTNLIIVLLGLKAMFWLLANEPALAETLHLYAVDGKKVPNTLNEEKQTYFGRFASLDYGKQSVKVGISGALVAFLGAALTLFLALTSQPLIAAPSNAINTRIYFEVTERSDIESGAWLEDNVLEYLTIEGDTINYVDVTVHELTRIEEEIEVDYRFFVVSSSSSYAPGADASYDDGINSYTGTLEEVLTQVVYGIDADEEVSGASVHNVQPVSAQPSIGQISLGVLAGVGAMMLYMFARHFAARTLSLLGVTSLATFITLTFFLLTRMPSLNIAGLAMYPVALLAVYLAVVIFSKEKELIEEASKDEDKLIVRADASKKAVSQSASILYVTVGLFAYVALNFFGFGPAPMSPLFAGLTIGVGIALLLVFGLLGPWSLCLAKTFAKWNLASKLPKPTKKTRKRKPVTEVKSAEPQEATFIGIND
jgi:preprotein translocase subunit SecF